MFNAYMHMHLYAHEHAYTISLSHTHHTQTETKLVEGTVFEGTVDRRARPRGHG